MLRLTGTVAHLAPAGPLLEAVADAVWRIADREVLAHVSALQHVTDKRSSITACQSTNPVSPQPVSPAGLET